MTAFLYDGEPLFSFLSLWNFFRVRRIPLQGLSRPRQIGACRGRIRLGARGSFEMRDRFVGVILHRVSHADNVVQISMIRLTIEQNLEMSHRQVVSLLLQATLPNQELRVDHDFVVAPLRRVGGFRNCPVCPP